LAFTALADLVGESFESLRAGLPRPQERALAAALLRADVGEQTDPRATATALVAIFGALAADAPLVVAVDDVQWLDRASERALEFAARRLPQNAVLLLTQRTNASERASIPVARMLADERVLEIELGPLSLAALHHILRH